MSAVTFFDSSIDRLTCKKEMRSVRVFLSNCHVDILKMYILFVCYIIFLRLT